MPSIIILIPLTFSALLLTVLSHTLLTLGRKIQSTPDKGQLLYGKPRDASRWHSPQRASRLFVAAFAVLFVFGVVLALSANRILMVLGCVAVVASVLMLGTIVFVALKSYGLMKRNENVWRTGVAI